MIREIPADIPTKYQNALSKTSLTSERAARCPRRRSIFRRIVMIRPPFAAAASARARSSTLTVALCLALLPSSGLSQQKIDTARVRATYDSVIARRNAFERVHCRYVNVDGI